MDGAELCPQPALDNHDEWEILEADQLLHCYLTLMDLLCSNNVVAGLDKYDPLSEHLGELHLSTLPLEHPLLHYLEDLPLVELEVPVLTVEFFPLLLVNGCNLAEDLSPLAQHLLLCVDMLIV